jgi:hypothetical protein
MGRSGWSGKRFLPPPSLERGYTLGKGASVDFLHLGHDIVDCVGYEAREGAIFSPVHGVPKTLDE